MGNAGIDKHFQEASLLFKKQSFISSNLSFFTDISGGYQACTLLGNFGSNTWGSGAWGAGLWGGVNRPKPIKCFIPRDKSRGTILSVKYSWRQAYCEIEVQGMIVGFAMTSERTNRA